MTRKLLLLTALCFFTSITFAQNDTAYLTPVKDNTLFEDATGDLSSGSGASIYSGKSSPTSGGTLKRAVLAFNMNDIPATLPEDKLVITKVTLILSLEQGQANTNMSLHKLTSDWGQGTSMSPGGQGTQAQNNDATWLHTFYNSQMWTTPGGDFEPTPSATTMVGTTATTYEWTSAQLKTDLEDWIANPSTNFGWILIGDEATLQTSKRFGSREHPTESLRPQLMVEYDIIAGVNKLVSSDIAIYPNPTSDKINININANINKADVEIVDVLGKVVYSASMGSSATISIADRPRGIYYVVIKTTEGTITKKINKL